MKTDSNPFLKWRQTFVLTFHVHPVIILLMFVNFIYEASASNQAFKDFKKSDPCPSEPHKWMDREKEAYAFARGKFPPNTKVFEQEKYQSLSPTPLKRICLL